MKLFTVFFLVAATAAQEKSANYYPDGMEDPNLSNKMYWPDAVNILEDISRFDALYITHHGCAWSEYDDGSGNGCGYAAMNEQSWYMGLAECSRANAAYSLYGILKGEEDTGCNSDTYINSFFTKSGIETFTTYMEYAGESFSYGNDDGGQQLSSACTAEANENQAAADDAYGYSHNENLGYGYTSYAVGCSAEGGRYVEKQFSGQYCKEREGSVVTDELNSFNQEMSQIKCKPIYTSGENNNNGGSPLELLAFSESCDVLEYPVSCPDPYGRLLKYEHNLEDSTGFVHSKSKERLRKVASWMLLIIGLLLIVGSLVSTYSAKKKAESAKQIESERKPTLWQRIKFTFGRIFRRKARNDSK